MRWQIGDFVFCDQQQTLKSEQVEQQLEPMMVELLSYFCLHCDQIISVDTLMQDVWLGRIVSDNAVSKLITKLRKAFSDNPRKPQYIATFPKKGYKFIAPVTELTSSTDPETIVASQPSDSTSQQQADDAELSAIHVNQSSQKYFSGGIFSIALLLIALLSWWIWQDFVKPPIVVSTHARSLTTDAGQEWFPSFSADGSRVAYLSSYQGKMALKIKHLETGEVISVEHGDDVGVGPGDWSKQGDSLVYLVASSQRCEYYQREITGMTLGEAELIYTCIAGSFGKVLYTHEPNHLVFAENTGPDTAYSIFQLDLTTGLTERVKQPDIYLGGNSQFDLHPFENKLLISSPDKQQWEGFYQLDLATDRLTQLFKQDAFICCGIWDHAGERIVLMGEYPAYQLVSYDLNGLDRQVLYSGSRKLSWPTRHINGQDYVFVSSERNADIQLFDLVLNSATTVANDSVDELLATFSADQRFVAYISMATGSEEIWLAELNSNNRRRLTQFNDGRHYLDLKWSNDGKRLIGLTFNEIHLIDAVTGTYERLNLPQKEIRGISFQTNTQISFSVKEGERWRVYTYDTVSQRVSAEDPMWSFVQFQHDPEDSLWVSRDNRLYAGTEPSLVKDEQISIEKLLFGRWWNLRKRGDNWFWYQPGPVSGIQHYSMQSAQIRTLVTTTTGHFDVSGAKILHSQTEQVNSNLYQTRAVN